ncbi:MAG: hypothetical protein JXJ20_00680 [Anaerolineae bacterium]|nr:hypothetical protein [Anaerolineae bacterium]
MNRWQLKLNNRVVALMGVVGVGLLPCPDCGLPLAVHIWPVAALVWVYRRVRRRGTAQLNALIEDSRPDDLPAAVGGQPPTPPTESRDQESATRAT